MTDDLGQFDENFFGDAFKFLDPPKQDDNVGGEEAGGLFETGPGRRHFKIGQWTKENKPESPRVLDPEHPLLEKFQRTLKEYLLKQIDFYSADVFAIETATKKKEIEREKLGIETYETQQVVCRQQEMIEDYMGQIQEISEARKELDNQIEQLNEQYSKERQKVYEIQKAESELRTEVETVNLLLQKLKCWENDAATDIKTNLRISDKTKKEKIKLATEKRDLDMIVYRLMTEVWKIENEIETLDMHLRVKEEERERIAIAVALSNTDIEALESENKCLINSWNTVIHAITARNKTYMLIEKDVRDVQEQIKTCLTEIESLKKAAHEEMMQNERLTLFKNRVQADLKNCQGLLDEELGKRDEIEKRIVGYQNIIEATDKNIALVQGENARREVEFYNLIKDFERLMHQKADIEERILKLLQDQITNDKAGKYLSKLVHQVRSKNRDMEITLALVENSNAKTLMDIEAQKYINEHSQRLIDEHKKQQNVLNTEIKKLTNDIDNCQFTMRRKQRDFDLLNKTYEQVRAKLEEKGSGTTQEEQIRKLEKEIEDLELENKSLQKYWLREQENMVIITQERQEQIKDNNILRKQILILEQKNLKIGDELEALRKQEEKMNRNITSLLSRQVQLQENFNKKKGNKENLGRDNIVMQTEYLCQLQDTELEFLQLEAQLTEMDESKTNLSKDLIERNREALAWEKKWQLAVEAKENMSKEMGNEGEMGHMKAEIHRMNVRYSQLKKAQDKLITDLEHCVTRREAIATVADAREKRGGGKLPPKINYQRKLDDLRNKIKKVQMEIETVDTNIDDAEKQQVKSKNEIKYSEKTIFKIQDEIEETKEKIELAKTKKQKLLELLVQKQRKLQMWNDLSRKRPVKMLYKDVGLQSQEFARQKKINEKLKLVLGALMRDYPDFIHEFQRIKNTVELWENFE